MKPRLATLFVTLAAAAGLTVAAPAQGPYGETPNVTLASERQPTEWDRPTFVGGRVLRGGRRVGVGLFVREGDRWRRIARTRASSSGRYRFTVRPHADTSYQAVAATRPATRSLPLNLRVRPLVGLRAQRSQTRGRVVFKGAVFPRHDGQVMRIQRRSPRGRWVTVARARLSAGDEKSSRYTRRLRVRRPGHYRAVLRAHADHAHGFSRSRYVRGR